MAGVIPNGGEVIALSYLVNKVATTRDLILRLYKNNYTPVEGSAVGNFTESTFTGYSAATLTGASWTVTGADPTTATYAQVPFTSSANQTTELCYGYYITRTTDADLVAAELFSDGPYSITNLNDAIKITPQINAT